MGHEVHVTRGGGFGRAGDDPITREQWTALVDSHAELKVRKAGSAFGRLHGSAIVFHAGVISATSPSAATVAALKAIAETLGARVFGEDGLEYGVDILGAVRATLAKGLPELDTSMLTDRVAQHLATVSDGDSSVAEAVRKTAVVESSKLDGPLAEVGLSYLACRAVESGGTPPAMATCVAAHLVRHASWRLARFRSDSTEGWVHEVEALAKLVAKKPGAYVVKACPQCGAKNRLPLFPPPDKRPKCGRCKTPLALDDA